MHTTITAATATDMRALGAHLANHMPGRVVGAAEPVGVHMDQVCGRAIGEVAVEFAGDGEGGRDDWLVNAQPGAESLGEGGFAGAQWPG